MSGKESENNGKGKSTSQNAKPVFEDQDTDDWERAGSLIWQPVPGDIILGRYDGAEPFTEGTLDTEVDKHFVITDNGDRYSFVGGQVFDKQIKSAGIKAGYLIRVEFKGKRDTGKEGRRVNIFDVRYKATK